MEKTKPIFKKAWPYQQDKLNLPVANVETAIPFYQKIMGLQLVSQSEDPVRSAILERDGIQFGFAENGGDPEQDGCFIAVDDVEATFAEFRSNGLDKEEAGFDIHKHGDTTWKVFFVVAPDGLCYCIGERQD